MCVDCFSDTNEQKTNREIANVFEIYDDGAIISDQNKAAEIILKRLKEAGAID